MHRPSAGESFHVVIVDDEPLARDGLRDAVGRLSISGVDLVGVCDNGVAALEAIARLEPQILLLDVAMPVLDGFAMLERLEPEATPPAIVFVTAYDEHAVRAFDAAAVDFLVKPVSDDRLRTALERAVRRVKESRAFAAELQANTQPSEPGYLRQLVIPERGRQLVIPVDDIEWIEGETYYVRVHARGGSRLLRERLSRLEAMLDPARFCRTHRSAIVRLDLVREVRTETPYSHVAVLANGAKAPVSRERLHTLECALGALRVVPKERSD